MNELYKDIEYKRAVSKLKECFKLSTNECDEVLSERVNKDEAFDYLDAIYEYTIYFYKLGLNTDEMVDILNTHGAINVDKIGDIIKEFYINLCDSVSSERINKKLLKAYMRIIPYNRELSKKMLGDMWEYEDFVYKIADKINNFE